MENSHLEPRVQCEDAVPRLCEVCAGLDFQNFPPASVYPRFQPDINLGSLNTVLKKGFCAFCRLVIGSLFPSASFEISFDLGWKRTLEKERLESCYLDPRVHGFETHWSLRVSYAGIDSRPIRILNAGFPKRMPGVIVEGSLDKPLEVGDTGRGQVDLGLVNSWLKQCEKTHDKPCRLSIPSQMDLIFIDVENRCLVEGTSKDRYVALSYVWGDVPMYQTHRKTYGSLKEAGAILKLGDQIPLTIRNTMEAVAALKEKYLWVDSLCIIQDDLANKRAQISQMNIIYDQAILTIVALSGENANGGLPGIDGRHTSHCVETVGNWLMSSQSWQLDMLLQESRYETRGWTFQERLLSRRCLYFSGNQIDFVCREAAGRLDHAQSLSRHGPETLRRKGTNPLQIPTETTSYFGHVEKCIQSYSSLVELYTKRNLSEPSDISLAFLGIEAEMKRLWKYEFSSSLPENIFDIALLWIPLSNTRRRTELSGADEKRVWVAPSWSWAGWTGGVYYDSQRLSSPQFLSRRAIKSGVSAFRVHVGNSYHGIARSRYVPFISRQPQPPSKRVSGEPYRYGAKEKYSELPSHRKDMATSINTDMSVPESLASEFKEEHSFYTDTLVFEAYTIPFGLDTFYLNFDEQTHDSMQAHRRTIPILDTIGKQCGALYGHPSTPMNTEDPRFELVSLSYILLQGTEKWLDDNPIFDRTLYASKPCCVHNIMCIKWTEDFRYAERISIGQIHAWAWEGALLNACKKISLI